MGLRVCSFGSGSKGNCVFVASDRTTLLVDAGIAAKRIVQCLKVVGGDPYQTSILITHSHSDHVASLNKFTAEYNCPVYCHTLSAGALAGKCRAPIVFDGEFCVGDIVVSPFSVSHDVPCVGYSFYSGGKKLSVATDIGQMTREVMYSLAGSDVVMLEANHDEGMLRANPRYSYSLKRRILSPRGHLSNECCAEAAVELAGMGTRQLILAHLSEENNTEELAYNTVSVRLSDCGIVDGEDIRIEVARQYRIGSVFEIS